MIYWQQHYILLGQNSRDLKTHSFITTSQNVIPESIYRESRVSFDSGFPIGTLGNDKVGHSQYIGPGPEDQVFCF